ncbi:MAG: helix-turn-helix domain-containing protein [Methylotenera sp.]|nr:helix-turn-helix domain-containing protein [Methylotenera sp.]
MPTAGTPTTFQKLALTEHEMAEALGLSVHTLRKDRQRQRRIPFFKLGSAVRYNVDRVREALAKFEEGGAA